MRFPRALLRTRRRILALIAGAVVIVAALFGVMYVRGSSAAPTYRTAAATLGTIRQTLSLTGNLTPVAQSNVSFQVSGTVTAVDVSVGQQITAGQVLATVDPTALQASLTQAQANLSAAQTKLSADQSSSSSSSSTTAQQVATARTNLANDQQSYTDTLAVNAQTMRTDQQNIAADQAAVDRDNQAVDQAQQRYNNDGCTSSSSSSTCQTDQQNLSSAQQTQAKDQQALATAQAGLSTDQVRGQQSADQAAAKLASDRTALSNAQSGSGSNSAATAASAVAQDQATITQDQQTVGNDQKAVTEATLLAPTDGQVAQINTAVGSSAGSTSSTSTGSATGTAAAAAGSTSSSSTTQFIILTPGSFQVTSTVSDSVVSQVAVGQKAVVTAAGSSNGLPATVTSVGIIGTVSSGVATFPVTVQITGSHPSLRDGMSASVTVVVNQLVGVLTVPTSAVHTNGTTSTVNVLKSGVSTPVVVTVGSADATRTQITSGLSEGDTVVIATVSSTVPTAGATQRRGGGLNGGAGGFAGPAPGG